RWHHDAQLQAGEGLTRWLHAQGVAPTQLEANYERGNNYFFGGSDDLAWPQMQALELCSRARDGGLAEALELCPRALALDPAQADEYSLRGQVHFHRGHVEEAGADCSAAIDRGPRHAEVFFIRAAASEGEGRTGEALAD